MKLQTKTLKHFLGIFAFVVTAESFAYEPEEGNVTASLGPFVYKTNFGQADVNFQSPERVGAALIATGDLNKNGALEIAVFTLNKSYLKERNGKFIVQDAELVHITMGYRYYMSRWLSTSLTLFSAYALGNPYTIYTEFSPSDDVDTSAKDNTEYGFDFAVQAELYSLENWAAVADARYSLSLTPKEHERGDHFGLLLGVRYLVLSRSKEK